MASCPDCGASFPIIHRAGCPSSAAVLERNRPAWNRARVRELEIREALNRETAEEAERWKARCRALTDPNPGGWREAVDEARAALSRSGRDMTLDAAPQPAFLWRLLRDFDVDPEQVDQVEFVRTGPTSAELCVRMKAPMDRVEIDLRVVADG